MRGLMGMALGLAIVFVIFTRLGIVVLPFFALFYLLAGRFFVASVLLAGWLYCGTVVWPEEVVVTGDEYKVLLILGLVLEVMKRCGVKMWWFRRDDNEVYITEEESPPTVPYQEEHEGPIVDLSRREYRRIR